MHPYIVGLKKCKGKVISFSCVFNVFETKTSYSELIQGVVREVSDTDFTIEQFLTYQDYVLGKNPQSVLRTFKPEDANLGDLIFPH
jgi:hypothetical protein